MGRVVSASKPVKSSMLAQRDFNLMRQHLGNFSQRAGARPVFLAFGGGAFLVRNVAQDPDSLRLGA